MIQGRWNPTRTENPVGHEETFEADILDVEFANKELLELAEKIARRMRKHAVAGRTVTLKVKYSDFRLVTRATTLRRDTDDAHEIYRSAVELLPKTEVGRRPVRLLGISISQLTFEKAEGQLSLFGDGFDIERREKLHVALDSLYDKHGEKAIRPATLLGKKGKKRQPI